ncbi:MAG TPA: nucleotidyltransferase domain-containing protein [Vicinamibacterales bacterium]|jgi:predicted nucleotidyltransferase
MTPRSTVYRTDAAGRARALWDLRDVLAAEPHVAFAFVFGSFTEDGPFHDIDVGVYVDGDLGRPGDLEERLTRAAAFPVDLVLLNGRPVTFLFHVYRGQVVFARSEAQLTAELERTMREYFDIAPVLRQATREAFGS